MKPRTYFYIVVSGCVLFSAGMRAGAQSAGPYDLSWSTIDGGGGTSSDGRFTISGSIGQPEPGIMTGDSFSLVGGFWSLWLENPLNTPTLTITRQANGIVISWPSTASGWVLEQTGNLAARNWDTSGLTVTDDGTTKSVSVLSTEGSLFFRLKK